MDTVRIAHISDLHFGLNGQKEVWHSLKTYLCETLKPELVLVTGDIVDTPDAKTYGTARSELDSLNIKYFVCAGNHDRHPKGNAPGRFKSIYYWISGESKSHTWFDNKFKDQICGLLNPAVISIGTDNNKWNLQIMSIDSSEKVEYSARGYVDKPIINKLLKEWKPQDADNLDIAILLVHHHLLSIPALEQNVKSGLGLLDFTSMSNAGSLLEALARSHIDIILHGHMHHYNWARYGTFYERHGETNVIGADSATGVVTAGATCDISKASFNLLELQADRSVCLTRVNYDSSKFYVGEFVQPLTIEELCEVINADNYNVTLQAISNTIDWLNELLKVSDFYDVVLKKKPNISISKNITDLVDKTKAYRDESFSRLNTDAQNNIKRLNRLLLEETYPQRTPKSLDYKDGDWTVPPLPDVQIYDSRKLARMRFFRRTKISAPPSSEMVKRVEFTRQRDVVIREYRTNWLIEKETWRVFARNSTGEPLYPEVYFTERGMDKCEFNSSQNFELAKEDHTYCYEIHVPKQKQIPLSVERIHISYLWSAGALLTEQDMAILDSSKAGHYRRDGYEFAAITALAHLESLSLTITIPREFVPTKSDDIKVFVENPRVDCGKPREKQTLRDRLQSMDDGVYSLIVPFPEKDSKYVIAWKVPSVKSWQPPDVTDKFIQINCLIGNQLIEEFYNGFVDEPLRDLCSIALYVPMVNKQDKKIQLKQIGLSTKPNLKLPPESIVLDNECSSYAQAWWGKLSVVVSDMDGDPTWKEKKKGLIYGEKALIMLPIRNWKEEFGGPPLWIVRVGINYHQDKQTLQEPQHIIDKMLPKLKNSIIRMINTFLSLS